MQVIRIKTGILATNTYLLKEKDEYLVIDPAGKAARLIAEIQGEVKAILLTHGHFDHIKAVDALKAKYHCPIYLNAGDNDLVDPLLAKKTNSYCGLCAWLKSPHLDLPNGPMTIGSFNFAVIATPGHTQGSVILVFDDVIFTGDTLFKGAVGRTDLYGGNAQDLKHSLSVFHDFTHDYLIYPGHDDCTTLSAELATNPYLK